MKQTIQEQKIYTVKVNDEELKRKILAEIVLKKAKSLKTITKNTNFLIYDGELPNLNRDVATIKAKNIKISSKTKHQLAEELVADVGNWKSGPSTQTWTDIQLKSLNLVIKAEDEENNFSKFIGYDNDKDFVITNDIKELIGENTHSNKIKKRAEKITSSTVADTFFSNLGQVYGNKQHCEAEVDSMVYIFLCGLGLGCGDYFLKQRPKYKATVAGHQVSSEPDLVCEMKEENIPILLVENKRGNDTNASKRNYQIPGEMLITALSTYERLKKSVPLLLLSVQAFTVTFYYAQFSLDYLEAVSDNETRKNDLETQIINFYRPSGVMQNQLLLSEHKDRKKLISYILAMFNKEEKIEEQQSSDD